MAGFMNWIKEHPFSAALVGLGLGWAIKVSLREYIPEQMEPRYKPEAMKAKSLRPGGVRKPATRGKPGELSGEFKELLEEPPAI